LATSLFAPQATTAQVEEGRVLAPKFDVDGLITCVITDARTHDLLMVAHMNAEALAKTIATGETWLYSRSRQKLWKKGETSGHVQRVIEMRVDCDQDAIWLSVEQAGAGACHTGRASCFYRSVPLRQTDFGGLALEFRDADKVFDPAQVYGGKKETPDA
jgi:phosphoribosyl-AMP cyclohydrolase